MHMAGREGKKAVSIDQLLSSGEQRPRSHSPGRHGGGKVRTRKVGWEEPPAEARGRVRRRSPVEQARAQGRPEGGATSPRKGREEARKGTGASSGRRSHGSGAGGHFLSLKAGRPAAGYVLRASGTTVISF